MSRSRFAAEAAPVAAWVLASVSAVAVFVRVAAAEQARTWLDFPFAGVDPTASTAISIFANNARMLLGVVAGAAVIQSRPCRAMDGDRSSLGVLVMSLLDTLFVLVAASNIVVVGAALGAYGGRMATAMLPHGPFELAAFAAVLTLYRRARRGPVPPQQIAFAAVACLGLILVGAVLETYAGL